MTVLRDDVFARMADPRLRIYAVWQPILSTDSIEQLGEAAAVLAGDARLRQYWDPRAEIGGRFARALGLPLATPAWDVYLLYDQKSRWDSSVPLPAFWMHQLGFPPFSPAANRFGALRLDGARFREEVEQLLAKIPPERK